jgi:tripartite-type tricarboxylate transporter receptor subunit TctC
MRRRDIVGSAALLLSGPRLAAAQQPTDFPDRPVRLVVGFPPGGAADLVPRILAEKLREAWGQPAVVENRPGAAGSVGATAVFRAPPDGYTLLATPAGPLVINQFIQAGISFDPARFTPLILAASAPTVLAVRRDLPCADVPAFLAEANAHPDKYTFASQGPGATSHLAGILFQSLTGVRLTHVPYNGSSPALNDLMAGTVDLMFDNLGSSGTLANSGRIRILAVSGDRRATEFPDVPTFREAGIGDFDVSTWFGVAGPPGMSDHLADSINAALNKVLAAPDTRARLERLSLNAGGGSRASFGAYVAAERSRWQDVIRRAGLTAD